MTLNVDPNPAMTEKVENLEQEVSELRACLRELIGEMTIRRIPERRLLNLRQEWILGYLRGEGSHKLYADDISEDRLSDGSSHWRVWFKAPSGVEATPTFYVLADDVDPELLLANRLECVLCMAHYARSTPTRILLIVEAMGNPLERLAQQADD